METTELHGTIPHIREIILFLVLAGILIPLLKRYRINHVLAFMLIGMIIGPYALGFFDNAILNAISFPRLEVVEVFAEVGIIYLLFSIGMHLSFEKLMDMRRLVLGAGITQMVITAILIAALIAAFGFSEIDNWKLFLVGSMMAFSSTAVVIQLLQDQKQTNSNLGRAVIAILLLQDLAVVPLLILVDSQNAQQSSLIIAITLAFVKALISITAIYFFGKRIIRPVFNYFADAKEPESFLALVLLSTLGIAGITWLAGLSMALGAMLAGLLLAETQFRHEIEVVLKPFGGLLIALLFFSMGMNINLADLFSNFFIFLGLAIVLYLTKFIIVGIILRISKLTNYEALEGGFLLGQGSEFAFIAVGIAVSNGVVDTKFASQISAVLALTIFITTIGAPFVNKIIQKQINRRSTTEIPTQILPTSALEDHVVLLGYGRVGQIVGRILDEQKIKYIAIDNNARHCSFFYNFGMPVYFGNEQNPELLRTFNLSKARCAVLTMNNKESAITAVKVLLGENPDLPIFARAHDKAHAQKLLTTGVKSVILETFEASLQLAHAVMREHGITYDQIQELVESERELRSATFENPKKEKVETLAI